MGFEIKINISEESPEGRKIREIMDRDHLTPEEIVHRSLRLYSGEPKSPSLELLGAFAAGDDAKAIDEALAIGKSLSSQSIRDFT